LLVRYALQVITAWIATGEIFARCREKKIRGAYLNPRLADRAAEEAEDIASEVVADAVLRFREDLKDHRWDPERGATLKTYFIGQCLIRFVGVIRAWRQNVVRQAASGLVTDERTADPAPGPAATALERDAVRRLLGDVSDPALRSILFLISRSFTHEEIAEVLGLNSAKAVEARLYRYRQRAKRVKAHA